jgi:hypothetical protein
MKLKTHPVKWGLQIVLVSSGIILCIYAISIGQAFSEWITPLLLFIIIAMTIECPLLTAYEGDISQ